MRVMRFVDRVEERIRDWGIVVQETLETPSSVVAFGRHGDQPVVLKALRQPGDEWRCAEILRAFDGAGVVRVLEYVEGVLFDADRGWLAIDPKGVIGESENVMKLALNRILFQLYSNNLQ